MVVQMLPILSRALRGQFKFLTGRISCVFMILLASILFVSFLIFLTGEGTAEPSRTRSRADSYESNDDWDEATNLSYPAEISISIDPMGDDDWFNLTFAHQGILYANFTEVPSAIWLQVEIKGPNSTNTYTSGGASGQGADFYFRKAVDVGYYYLRVFDHGMNSYSTTEFTMSVDFEAVNPDPLESNDDATDATPIAVNSSTTATIFPNGDIEISAG